MPRSRLAKPNRIFQILVIDDNPADARLLEEAWTECKAVDSRVAMLHKTKDAIIYLRGIDPYSNVAVPDLVLLDYKMPVDGGIALTEIKGDPDYMHIPVVVFSGSEDIQDYYDAYQRRANCCFRKPNDLDELIELINHIAEHWFLRAVLPRR
jgi:CheY-like chemotaxis protein